VPQRHAEDQAMRHRLRTLVIVGPPMGFCREGRTRLESGYALSTPHAANSSRHWATDAGSWTDDGDWQLEQIPRVSNRYQMRFSFARCS
jgi:hypothetical protein